MTDAIQSRMPRADYDAIKALNMSRLKEMKRSPLHYRHALTHSRKSGPMTLGLATHVAVLEPERFMSEFANWDRRTKGGNSAPRNGQWWDAFLNANTGKTILTEDEWQHSQDIAAVVRADALAMRYLAQGEPEVTFEWDLDGRACKGRVDWLTTIEGEPTIVGLKTTRDCRHFAFGSQAAKLGYHLQFSWYHDGYERIRNSKPKLVEIVVESAAPHAVAVYRIPDDIIEQGRDEYIQLLEQLANCEATDEWPGPQPIEDYLTLPSWVYGGETDNELSELELTE